jgi:hypothetical protein
MDWDRNHILIDTNCCGLACLIGEYNKGRKFMKLDDPADKLLLPAFEGDAPDKNDRLSPPPLTDTDRYFIRESFKKNLRRKDIWRGRFWGATSSALPFAPTGRR